MRNLLHIHPDGLATQPYNPPSQPSYSSPSPSPAQGFPDFIARESFFFDSIPVPDTAFDLATISFIAVLLLLSLLAFSFIFHLHLKSRRVPHLQNFNSLWTVRLLLVSLSSLWAVNEILRLPILRRKDLYPFLPSINLQQQADICKLHVVLSLGLFEPGFFIALLFLVNVSIRKRSPGSVWALASVLFLCSPTILLQIIFVYFPPFEANLPKFMHGSSVLLTDLFGDKMVLCTYPFFSCVIFFAFMISYAVAFLLSCWRVMAFVINKGISHRISVLATTVVVALALQILCLSMTWLLMPEDAAYGWLVLAMFLLVAWCMSVGEAILVLKPIKDALAAGEEQGSGLQG